MLALVTAPACRGALFQSRISTHLVETSIPFLQSILLCCLSFSTTLTSISGLLSSGIEGLFITDPRSHITVLGDCNVHGQKWLGHSDTSNAGREAEQFAESSNLSQLIQLPTRIPDRTGDCSLFLDFIFTSVPSLYLKCSIPPLAHRNIVSFHHPSASSVANLHPPQDTNFSAKMQPTWTAFAAT